MSASRWMIPMMTAAISAALAGCTGSPFLRTGNATAEKAGEPSGRSVELAKTLDASAAEQPLSQSKLPAPKEGLDQDTLQELMAELNELRETDPEAQAELMKLVQDGDPALIPGILNLWKTVLKQQIQNNPNRAVAGNVVEPLPTDGGVGLDPRALETDLASRPPGDQPIQPTLYDAPEQSPNQQIELSIPDSEPVGDSDGFGGFSAPEPLMDPELSSDLAGTQPRDTRSVRSGQDWDSHLNQLIAQTEGELASSASLDAKARTEKQVYLRLLYLMAGMNAQALEPIEGVDATEKEFWKNTLWAMSDYFDHETIPQGANRATEAVKRLTIAANRLREKAALEVTDLAFCRRINSFGNYEPFAGHPNYQFKAGQQVLLYSEVKNFESQLDQNQFRTVLRSTIQILDAQGREVWRQQFAPTVDLCRNRRTDFFLTFAGSGNLRVPKEAGGYVLKLIVEDQLAQKRGEASLPLTIQ